MLPAAPVGFVARPETLVTVLPEDEISHKSIGQPLCYGLVKVGRANPVLLVP